MALALSNNNRTRHQSIFSTLLDDILKQGLLKNTETGGNINSTKWTWGPLGPRLGSRRSADGIIFDLRGNKIAKFIFSQDDSPENEIRIGKILGDHGISPKIYAGYKMDFGGTSMLNQISNFILKTGRGRNGYVNLFQEYNIRPFKNQNFRKMFIVIMDKLEGYTLKDVLNKKPGTENIHVSERELMSLVNKMHKLGIIHGDMHPDNIYIQVSKSGKVELKLIDFGRSINSIIETFNNPREANLYILSRANRNSYGMTRWLKHFPTLNGIPSHVYMNGLPIYRNSAALNYSLKSIKNSGINLNTKRNAIMRARKAAANIKARRNAVVRRVRKNEVIEVQGRGLANLTRVRKVQHINIRSKLQQLANKRKLKVQNQKPVYNRNPLFIKKGFIRPPQIGASPNYYGIRISTPNKPKRNKPRKNPFNYGDSKPWF